MIRLFPSTESDFTSNGQGILADALSCIVTQELNGQYEVAIRYPVTGQKYDLIALRSIVVCSVDPVSDPQPFRVYRITQPLNGIVTIYGRHLAYDLQGIVLAPFVSADLHDALLDIPLHSATSCPFVFTTDKVVASPFVVDKPYSIWSILAGQAGSLLDVYGGEYEFDEYEVILHNRRGSDRGVTISYGKNLTSYQQDSNNSNVWTGVFPYWSDGGTLITLPEQIIYGAGTYDFERILSLDMTEDFAEAPSEADLRAAATAYVSANDIGVPRVSWSIGFVQLEQSGEYVSVLTRCILGDTIRVYFPLYSVTATSRVVGIKWDALLERYNEVTLGSVRANLASTIAAQQKEVEAKPTQTRVEIIAEALAQGLLGANDGIVRLLDTNNDGSPDELYIADNADPALAVNVWRFNANGWAASSTGYNGTYTLGATIEDGLLANFVTAANLVAGTIQSADGTSVYMDLDNGVVNLDISTLKLNGQDMSVIINGVAQDAADATAAVQNSLDDLKAHIVINPDGSMTFIGADNNPVTLRIVNDQLGIYNGSDRVAYFGDGGAYVPNLTVSVGGSLTMGRFKWAPRTNGNLSLLYVGA